MCHIISKDVVWAWNCQNFNWQFNYSSVLHYLLDLFIDCIYAIISMTSRAELMTNWVAFICKFIQASRGFLQTAWLPCIKRCIRNVCVATDKFSFADAMPLSLNVQNVLRAKCGLTFYKCPWYASYMHAGDATHQKRSLSFYTSACNVIVLFHTQAAIFTLPFFVAPLSYTMACAIVANSVRFCQSHSPTYVFGRYA